LASLLAYFLLGVHLHRPAIDHQHAHFGANGQEPLQSFFGEITELNRDVFICQMDHHFASRAQASSSGRRRRMAQSKPSSSFLASLSTAPYPQIADQIIDLG
jgi:hypothetical protein